MEINATFRCIDFDKQINIQCKSNEKKSTVLERFANKIFADKIDYEYFYNGKEINVKDKDLTIINLINDKSVKTMELIIKRRNKIFKCPQCTCNNRIIKIDN